MSGFAFGGNTTATMSPTELLQGKAFGVGDSFEDAVGAEWVFVQALAPITTYSVCSIDANYGAVPMSNATASAAGMVGVAATSFLSGYYGWMQQRGNCTIQVLASAAKNAGLHSTVTGGAMDTTTISTSTNYLVIGLVALSAGSAGGATNVPAIISYPNVLHTTAGVGP